ncbi:hypothetical protein MBLNU457_2372t1 [Dothideomycetes sp. NU457]
MAGSWTALFLELSLSVALVVSTIITVIIFTLPSHYEPNKEEPISEDDFAENEKTRLCPGLTYLNKYRGDGKTAEPSTSVTILVLGDIGRSPRMQYHATSIASHGGRVELVGYVESDVLPEIQASPLINIVALNPVPERLRTSNKIPFAIIGPLKVLYQIWNLYFTLAYKAKATKFMLVQNPPSIPTLVVGQLVCFLRHSKLIIDWHNLGHTILALKLGQKHALVKMSEAYESYIAKYAFSHFAVSKAMAMLLKRNYGIEAQPLYDRPARQFQPLTAIQRAALLAKVPETAKHAIDIQEDRWKLLVSSTSWTPDEDFSILLDALVAYSATVTLEPSYPKLLVIITGKGPLKGYYLEKIEKLNKHKKLLNCHIRTAWLTMEDYAGLLGSADLGVSLHMSSSGVDLPMKVVDMFGAACPVVGWDNFAAWPELVQEGVNGMGFQDANSLSTLLEKLFANGGVLLEKLRKGALIESQRRWEDEWPTAAKVLGISPET